MHNKQTLFSRSTGIVLAAGILLAGMADYSLAGKAHDDDDSEAITYTHRATPLGYRKYIIIMGNGAYPSPDGTRFLGGLEGGDGMAFQRESMQRSPAEIAQLKQEALDFFQRRFGIYAESDERVAFTGFQIDPRNNIRAYSVSDEDTPLTGWEVESGGWQVIVTDPDGLTLGGEFASRNIHVGQGTFFLFGDHKINRTDRDGGAIEPIVIRFKTSDPYKRGPEGGLILLDLESEQWGKGADGGSIVNSIDADGILRSRLRSVMTFPPLPEIN